MQSTVISLTLRLKICFASLWSSLGVRSKVETRGEWEIKGEHFKPRITNREQNHRTTARQWTPTQDGKTDVPDKRHMLDCWAKGSKHKNKTIQRYESSSWGLPWPNGNNRKNENPWNYNYERKLPPQLIHWTCWVSRDVSLGWNTRWHRYSHALVMKAMVSWLATKLSLHATQWS